MTLIFGPLPGVAGYVVSDMAEIEDEPSKKPPSSRAAKILRAKIETRCKAASLPFEDIEGDEEGQMACKIAFPCGRDKRWIYLSEYTDYQSLNSINFEQYSFLSGLDAVCAYTLGSIEATVQVLGGVGGSFRVYRAIFGFTWHEYKERVKQASITLESESGGFKTKISLGLASPELQTLGRHFSRQVQLSLKIQRDGLNQHEQCLELVRRVADTLFFQIDLMTEIPLSLARERKAVISRARKKLAAKVQLSFPTYEYDAAPISLYWYARSALGMPLLQFLAFYQVIEFYFPTYSQVEARRKLKNILKDPTFRVDRDTDIGRALSSIQLTRIGGYGDERAQLRATVMECVDAEALREFLIYDEGRKSFFSKKTKISDQKLPIASLNADLRNDVADRIYDIRCKIVHTKTDARSAEIKLLLPFSSEAEQLSFDIELVQYIAQQVLITSSAAFQL